VAPSPLSQPDSKAQAPLRREGERDARQCAAAPVQRLLQPNSSSKLMRADHPSSPLSIISEPVPTKKLKAPPAPKKRKVSASQLPSDDEGDTGGNARAGPSTSGSHGALAPSRRVPNAGSESESDDDDPEFLRRMEEMENGAPAAKKTKKAAAKKPAKRYFPKQASGAYAILLALHSVSSTEDMHVELNKKEIIDIAEAKGWSDASFNKPKDGGFATAWNGCVSVGESPPRLAIC
jgi:hypothetical protein